MNMKKLYEMIATTVSGRTLIFILITLIGAAQIFIQLFLPDIVSDAAINLLIQNNSPILGYEWLLKFSLVLWVYGGIFLFMVGVVAATVSHILDYTVYHHYFFSKPVYSFGLQMNSKECHQKVAHEV